MFQNSQEKTQSVFSNFVKKETQVYLYSREFCQIFKIAFYLELL